MAGVQRQMGGLANDLKVQGKQNSIELEDAREQLDRRLDQIMGMLQAQQAQANVHPPNPEEKSDECLDDLPSFTSAAKGKRHQGSMATSAVSSEHGSRDVRDPAGFDPGDAASDDEDLFLKLDRWRALDGRFQNVDQWERERQHDALCSRQRYEALLISNRLSRAKVKAGFNFIKIRGDEDLVQQVISFDKHSQRPLRLKKADLKGFQGSEVLMRAAKKYSDKRPPVRDTVKSCNLRRTAVYNGANC